MRLKVIPRAQFQPVIDRKMKPVILADDIAPDFYHSIPENKRCCIIASGEICSTGVCAEIDTIRSSPDDPTPYNRDWYRIFPSADAEILYAEGPIIERDNHHIHEIPHADAEVIGDPTKIKVRLI